MVELPLANYLCIIIQGSSAFAADKWESILQPIWACDSCHVYLPGLNIPIGDIYPRRKVS